MHFRPVSVNMRFSYNLAEQAARKIADLWNIYVFLVNYAIIDQPNLSEAAPSETLQVTDRWLLARTSEMIENVKKGYDAFDTPSIIRDVEAYLDDVSNWYVRVSRRRFWRSGHEADKRAAYFALFTALRSTVLVLSPIIPFVTERIWQNAVRGLDPGATESVHHADWPEPPAAWKDQALLRRTEAVRNAIRLGLKVRAQGSVRVRQPLEAAHIVGPPALLEAVEEQQALIQSELNVKNVVVTADRSPFFQVAVAVDWKAANSHLRRDAGRFRAAFDALDKQTRDSLAEKVAEGGLVSIPGFDQALPANLFRIEREPAPRYKIAEEGEVLVALDAQLTDALKREGIVRDLVRNLQVARKDAGLSVSQRIELGLATESHEIQAAIGDFSDYIKEELLATRLEYSGLEPYQAKVDVALDGQVVLATMRW